MFGVVAVVPLSPFVSAVSRVRVSRGRVLATGFRQNQWLLWVPFRRWYFRALRMPSYALLGFQPRRLPLNFGKPEQEPTSPHRLLREDQASKPLLDI